MLKAKRLRHVFALAALFLLFTALSRLPPRRMLAALAAFLAALLLLAWRRVRLCKRYSSNYRYATKDLCFPNPDAIKGLRYRAQH